MKANSEKTKQSKKATRRVLAGVLCGASVLSLVLSLVMPPISQAIANDAEAGAAEETVAAADSSTESTDVENTNNGDTKKLNSGETEGGATEDAAAAGSTADSVEAKGAAQPSDAQLADDENNDENANAPATVSANDYTEVSNDVSEAFANGGKFRLTGSAYSDKQIDINKDTTIDLNGNMLYHRPGSVESFIVVQKDATLTIEDSGEDSGGVVDHPKPFTGEPGQPAEVEWTSPSGNANNKGTPKSLTYFETVSKPTENGLRTTETTTKHVVTGFGAIDAASDNGSVKQVVYVEAGGTLNLKGGMITTAANLRSDGHIIGAAGTVNIEGGYIAGGNCGNGGWGGGLLATGQSASINMADGVIAANMAASGGGIYADGGATLNLSGGVISGNATYEKECNDGINPMNGYGGGVFTKGANVNISGSANITNNRVDSYVTDSNIFNCGLLGGGGIASVNGGALAMEGGSVTANYSKEAGGGIYAGFWNQAITFTMTGGTIAGNKSVNGEGGGLRIAGGATPYASAMAGGNATTRGTYGTINASRPNMIYITNNTTMTGGGTSGRKGDWGGGGIFVQEHGRLNVPKSLITNNNAGGWSGGIGACPTGETIVSHSNGAAIYDNTDNVDQDGTQLETPHYSAGGTNNDKGHDQDTKYITSDFLNSGHKDFFLVRNKDGANSTIAVVLGKMLGGGSAGWQGTCDGKKITIDANGGAEAKYMFGLKANPTTYAKEKAQAEATTIISGNYSYTHGGGIMTNGDLIVGDATEVDVYPAIKVKANKVLMKDGDKQDLNDHSYQFELLSASANSYGEPFWNEDGSLNENGCKATPEFTLHAEGKTGEIVIDTAAYQPGNYDLYLVEVPIEEKGTKFDKSIYKIHVEVSDQHVDKNLLGITVKSFSVNTSTSKVSVKKEDDQNFTECNSPEFYKWSVDPADSAVSTVTIGNDSSSAFTNEYQASGSWTPQVTKKVDGGEMKKFKFELYTEDGNGKKVLDKKWTTDDSNSSQTVKFDDQKLEVSDFNDGKATFTYYIRECDASKVDGTKHEGYKNDTKRFKVVVTATDNGDGTLKCTPVYYEVDANGHENKTPTDTPTFTNTYSTTLPLSGMSGVTLTYLAGAAVLCAAAAWMHIRRKANAKGGKRHE